MSQSHIFADGILHEGQLCTQFTLEPETFGHTLALLSNPQIDVERLQDEAYHRACLFAQRLTIEGVPNVTPDIVLGLSGTDGRLLLAADANLMQRRLEFRSQAQTAAQTDSSPAETGH